MAWRAADRVIGYGTAMAFEVFTPQATTAAGQAYVSIQRNGIISLNRSAYALLGEPAAVELLFDREHQRVGLRAADPSLGHAPRVRPSRSSVVVSAARFTHHYDIDTTVGRRWPAAMEDDVLVFDVSQPSVA